MTSFPALAAATRQRVAAYVPYLERAGVSCTLAPLLDDDFFRDFYSPGGKVRKAAGLAARHAARAGLLLRARRWDAVFVQREAAIVGPEIIEVLLVRGAGLPLIYDIDDAIWLTSGPPSSFPLAKRLLTAPGKSARLVGMARQVIAGSRHLAAWCEEHGASTTVLPTVVSRETWRPRQERERGDFANDVPVVGWVGSHSTAVELARILPALARLRAESARFRVRVVGAGVDLSTPGLEIENTPWSESREIEDFRSLDVGLAPMGNDAWSEGKCGYKQLQYMAVGVPCVSSLAGGAREFIVPNENALLAGELDEWTSQVRRLLEDRALRARLSAGGRALVEKTHCLEAQAPTFVGVVQRAFSDRTG